MMCGNVNERKKTNTTGTKGTFAVVGKQLIKLLSQSDEYNGTLTGQTNILLYV